MIRWYPWQPSQQHLNETDFILFIFCKHIKVKMHFSGCGFQEWEDSLAFLVNGDSLDLVVERRLRIRLSYGLLLQVGSPEVMWRSQWKSELRGDSWTSAPRSRVASFMLDSVRSLTLSGILYQLCCLDLWGAQGLSLPVSASPD